MRIFFVCKIFFYDLRLKFFSMRVIDKKNCVKPSYCTLKHTLILKKFQNIAKNFAKKFYTVFLYLKSSTTG